MHFCSRPVCLYPPNFWSRRRCCRRCHVAFFRYLLHTAAARMLPLGVCRTTPVSPLTTLIQPLATNGRSASQNDATTRAHPSLSSIMIHDGNPLVAATGPPASSWSRFVKANGDMERFWKERAPADLPYGHRSGPLCTFSAGRIHRACLQRVKQHIIFTRGTTGANLPRAQRGEGRRRKK